MNNSSWWKAKANWSELDVEADADAYWDEFAERYEFNARAQVVIYAAYGCLLCACVLANVTVLLLVALNRALWTVTNMLVCNLAVGGLCMSVPLFITPHTAIGNAWLWSETVCKAFATFSVLGVLVTSFTLATIALHRFATMLRLCPSAALARRPLLPAALWCLAVWAVAGELSVPLWVTATVHFAHAANVSVCTEEWSNMLVRTCYSWLIFVLQFLVPAIVMTFCHVRIYAYLRTRTKKVLNRAQCAANSNKLERINRRRRVHQVLMLMVLSYIVTWLPWNVIYILVDQFPEVLSHSSGGGIVYLVSHFLAMTSAVLNPLMYALFRQECREKLLACERLCGSPASLVRANTRAQHSRFLSSSIV